MLRKSLILIPVILFAILMALVYLPQPRQEEESVRCVSEPLWDPAAYAAAIEEIGAARQSLAKAYLAANAAERNSILSRTSVHFTDYILYLADHWYGTRWSFSGTTREPNRGNIACGYFVTTLLSDAGLRINRVKLAQAASSELIRKVCGKEMSWLPTAAFSDFLAHMGRQPDGLYIIGLSTHVGLFHKGNNQNRFIHSSNLWPGCAINEKAEDSRALAGSAVYVVGNLSQNKHVMEKWLKGENF